MHLDPARAPRGRALKVIDHDRRPTAARDVAELLGRFQLVTADVDRVPGRVVDPSDRDHMRRAVHTDRRDAAKLAPAAEVAKLGITEHAHRRAPCYPRPTRPGGR